MKVLVVIFIVAGDAVDLTGRKTGEIERSNAGMEKEGLPCEVSTAYIRFLDQHQRDGPRISTAI